MEKIELHKVCKIGNGFAFKSEDYLETGIPLLRISNINNGIVNFKDDTICVAENYLETKNDFIVEKGDVVIALSGATTGKYGIYINDEPALLNQRIGIIKSNSSKKLNSKYFYFYLNVLKDEILRKAGGAAQPNISTKEIGNLEIPLPPIVTQQKIAAILSKADELRQYNKRLIEKYDDLSQSLFLDMFGDPVRNEKGWEKIDLGEISNKITDGEHQNPSVTKFGKNLIMAKDVLDNIVDFSTPRFVSEENYLKYSKKCNPEPDDILLVSRGATVGRCTIVKTDIKFCLMGSVILIKKGAKFESEYLCRLLKNEKFLKQLTNVSSASAQQAIYISHLKKLIIPLPPIELQNQFAERVQLIETQKKQAQEALSKSDDLFQGLLQRAFRGELN